MRKISCLLITIALCLVYTSIAAVPGSMSYQGRLTDASDNPVADGIYEISFTIYDAATAGNSKWSEDQLVTTVNGLFSVLLGSVTPIPDSVFNSDVRYLGIRLRGEPEMTPRTRLVTVPYAFRAAHADTAKYAQAGPGGGSGGWIQSGNIVSLSDPNDSVGIGTASPMTKFDVNGDARIEDKLSVGPGTTNTGANAFAAGENVTASGDNATVSGGSSNTASGPISTIGGGNQNSATDSACVVGGGLNNEASYRFATVSGGGDNVASNLNATVGGGFTNIASAGSSTVGGGNSNSADGVASTVSGGFLNRAVGLFATVSGGAGDTASGLGSVVSGGWNNLATDSGATVSGGWNNEASFRAATIGGGRDNIASDTGATIGGGVDNHATSYYSTVSGGIGNSTTARSSTVGGGRNNTADDIFATIGGGVNNLAQEFSAVVSGGHSNIASGLYSTVAGGYSNLADGNFSFAAGRRAYANHAGAFVWGDNGTSDSVYSTGTNQFRARTTGGVWFFTNGSLTTGVTLASGGGSWSSVSDSTVKKNIRPVDGVEILEKLSQLDISRWNYETQDPSIEHIGPMAQDFYRLFGVGDDNKTITTVDPDGVSLAAIKALIEKNDKLSDRLDNLEAIIEELKARR